PSGDDARPRRQRARLRPRRAASQRSAGLESAGPTGGYPVAHLEPVTRAKGFRDARLRVRVPEDMPLEVAANRDVREGDLRDVHQRVRRQPRLGDRVVLELELGSDLHQLRPIGTRPRAHRARPMSGEEAWGSREVPPQTTKKGARGGNTVSPTGASRRRATLTSVT